LLTRISIFLLFFLVFSHIATAKDTPLVVLDGDSALTNAKVCWYENKRYTEGAIIAVANSMLICATKTDHLSNSDLMWYRLNENGDIIYPKQAKTIRVN